jgi:hypothetical protein
MKMKKYYNSIFFAAILFCACTNTEIADSSAIDPSAIALDYELNFSEGKDYLTLKTKFRVGGNNGTTLVLNKPSKVTLNNNSGKLDSSNAEGAYYYWDIPTTPANYKIDYTDKNGKILSNSFNFNGFKLTNPLPTNFSSANNFVISLEGIANNNNVTIGLRDTAKNDIDLNLPVINNQITISKTEIQKLKRGPITVNIGYRKSEPIKETNAQGGTLEYYYNLKQRTINLK